MIILAIDGTEVRMQLSADLKDESKSQFQEKCKEALIKAYPHEIIIEEFFIPKSRLSVDFFIPRRRLVVEVQGSAHTRYIAHFHGEKTNNKFAGQVMRDVRKANWCEINGFRLIEIFSEKDIDTIT